MTTLSLRYSFQVPTFAGKKHMLSGYALQHVVLMNRVDADEFADPKDPIHLEYKGDVNKLALVWASGARKRLQAQYKLTDAEMDLVKFKGLSACRHEAGEKIESNDPRWV